jgi:GNAT superfamily N-acetyltransferase
MKDLYKIREAKEVYFNEIFNIQKSTYKDFAETNEAVKSRLDLSVKTCFVARVKNEMAGYLLSHPWKVNLIPALNTVLDSIPLNADCFYIHDLAILKKNRKAGIGEVLIKKGIDCAIRLGFIRINLVAINDYAKKFYKTLGFKVKRITHKDSITDLIAYGESAEYMQLDL